MKSNASPKVSASSTHVQRVYATSGGLIKATLGAAAVAGAILTFAWLPAEHGIDPTGVGHLLGLTEMGHIKEQLHAEADAEAAASLSDVQADSNGAEIHQKLDAIQIQLTAIAATVEKTSQTNNVSTADQAIAEPRIDNTVEPVAAWLDEVSYTLSNGEGIEVKLVMAKGAIAEFEWSANGAVLNHDTHGDGDGQNISYEKGRHVPEQAGQLIAAFTGTHGWYWRNRTGQDVVVTLRTRGDYTGMVLP